ncbi:MAG: aspartate-alanine antiporter [Muribaculaceae bacterium]|nr:aspartate-alanine antiporter [Muribaculaceae bacterium]
MYDTFLSFLQTHQLIPVFLTLGLGFWLGKLRFGTFSLGPVAATLIVGVIIGQIGVEVPDIVKNVFFLFFLFSVGYGVGPQFFRAFRGDGVKIVIFAAVAALVSAGVVIGAAMIMGYSKGVAAGLFAGSQTASASLGLLSDTVRSLPVDDAEREHMLKLIPACYAATYVLGTVFTAWFLSSMAPRMLGGLDKVKADVAAVEQRLDSTDSNLAPGMIPARRKVVFRAYEVSDPFYDTPRTPAEISEHYASAGVRVIVERARIDGIVTDPTDGMKISKGDHVVLGGRAQEMVALPVPPGQEVVDPELLNFGAERTPVTIASGEADGLTLGQLRGKDYMERVAIAGVRRNGLTIPDKNNTTLCAGDVLTLVGWPRDVADAAARIGYADRDTNTTDMVFVGLGIAAGCIIGALSVNINGIPMALGMSVGALLSGLVLGWLRARRPSFGHIPSSALWIFNNLGVNMFISVLGLSAGGALVVGLREAGVAIVGIGLLLTFLSIVINIFIASRIFRFSTPEVLGCVAGARCSVASIGAITSALGSDVPNLSFTITFAVANLTLVFSSLLVLFLV